MTLQQLFRTANFDQAFTYITKFHPKSANSRFPFQVAFEWLCEVEPVTTDEEIEVIKRPFDEDDEAPDVYVWCSHLEGCDWSEAMGLNVVLAPEVKDAPIDMVVGMCLWHLTFYGLSQEVQTEGFESMLSDDEDTPNSNEPDDESDILSEETRSLYPDIDGFLEDDYDEKYAAYSEAVIKELTQRAANGETWPQFFLAKIYSEGYYGITPDLSRAIDLYKLAATKGLYRAQNNLAAFYENGIVVEKDTLKARELYKVAAQEPTNNGVPEENLGHLELEEGNRQEAIKWFKQAADKGNTVCKSYVWYLELDAPKWT